MPVSIRLSRVGRKKKPCYRIVVMDSRKRRDGAYLEQLGLYHPDHEPAVVDIKEERALHWLSVGAQPSDTVRSIFSRNGLMVRFDLQRRGANAEKISEAAEKVKTSAKARELRKIATRRDKKAAAKPVEVVAVPTTE